jgi:hypothetical protein
MFGLGRSPDVDETQEEEPEAEAEEDPNEFFEIVGSAPACNTSRCTEQTRYLVRFREVEECNRPDQLLERVLDAIYKELLDGRPTPKLIGLSLQPPDFQDPYNIPLRGLEQNSPAVIAAAIQDLALRYPTLDPFSGTCEIKVSIVWPLSATAAASSGLSAVGPSGACSTLSPEFYGLPEARLLQTWLTQQFGPDSVRLIILGYEQQYRVVFRGVDHPTRINLCIYLQQKHYSFVGRPEQLFNV